MNEDDTFKALRKIPYKDVLRLYSEELHSDLNRALNGEENLKDQREKFLNKHGWTRRELLNAIRNKK